MKCIFIGDGQTIINGDYNIIICVNPSVIHIDKKIKFHWKFIDEAHHLEDEDGIIRKKMDTIKGENEIHFSATFHDNKNLDYVYGFDSAIKDGYISDYVLHFSIFDEGTNRMDAMIERLKKNPDYFPMFIYFNTTDRSKTFSDKLIKAGFKANYLDGNSNSTKRKNVKSDIENGKLDILCVCQMYSEGISIDRLRSVVFFDKRYSPINRIQISMRAIRKHKSKPFARIIIPLSEDEMKCKNVKKAKKVNENWLAPGVSLDFEVWGV